MRPVEGSGSGPARPLFPLREVVLGAFAPSLLFGVAIGIVLPLIPSSAARLGADLATAGLAAALLPIGKVLGDLPAGALAARVGDRRAMVLATVLALGALAGAALAPTLWLLQGSVLALGVATAVFHLARHAYLTEITPATQRARVLSTLGGVHRVGYLVGPFLGAGVIATFALRPAYWLATGCAVLTLAVLVVARPPVGVEEPKGCTGPPTSLLGQARTHRRLFLRLGTATLLVGAVRGARQTVLPLWGEYLHLDPVVISLVFGLSGAVDVLLFYPAGKVMDHLGRLWIAIPSMVLLAAAMAALPLTGSVTGISVAAALLGLGNGLGAGIMMTIAADVAPADSRSSFLGVWRLFQDSGDALGPLVVTAGAALGSLAAGIWVASLLGAAAAGALGRWVPRFSVHANGRSRRAAGII